ncbi:NYN domain-containing protein [Pseudoduganella sp. FT25W]|uniref:NYN domain-containing protein n=1 Tax=Duganella alba TaxID=2666081 RepID=A0A6L5QCD6_9BURK|nr:NYN domain-containing protein [Duganella alba]MRX07309.1 NYN domain-containing protein [Duganella alba]MRX14996.1 NYN domain-containing protein [Duganella alba]
MEMQRTIGFADGENLVMRFQAMVEAGAIPKNDVVHERDCLVWHPEITRWSMFDFVRFNYYTSTTGDMPKVNALRDSICNVEYEFTYTHNDDVPYGTANLVPHVFHKPSKNTKARNVDLQISIDVLRAAHLPSVDSIFILSGDGDYIPLIQEASRHGKEIWLGAFSSGLHPSLRHYIDVFCELDDIFFSQLPQKS